MKIKRYLILAFCLFILGTFISACGGGGKTAPPPSYPFIPTPTPTPTPTKYPIELSKTEFTINIGETDNIIVTLNGEDITQNATYTVDQEAIASVEGGLITGISAEIATVTVNAENAESEKKFTVNVIDPTLPTLEVSQTELNLGIEEEANVAVTLEGKDVTEQVTYKSDKELIATADKGIAKAGIQAGIENSPLVAKITVSLEGANSASFTVNVTDDSDNEVTLNDEILNQLYELGIIAKSSADKTKLTEANIPAIFKYTDGKKYKITSITEDIFKECTLLKTITIPNTVTSIGSSAFYNCSSLKEIVIPDNVPTIGDNTFYGCSSLETITIPNTVTSIGNSTFNGCSSLEIVTIPNSVTSIGHSIFRACSSLETVTIPNTVTSIGNNTFYGCSSLETVTIPNSVKTIGSNAFDVCTSLETVTIPNSVKTIGSNAFHACTSLETITIPNSVTSIEFSAFSNCVSLKKIVIPNSVTTIEDNTFHGCYSLKEIVIPDSVIAIESEAFYECTKSNLSIDIPSSVARIGKNAFYRVYNINIHSGQALEGYPWGAKNVNNSIP